MNKLLISLLSLVGASAAGTCGYFLLRNGSENVEDSKPIYGEQEKGEVEGGGEEAKVSAPEVSNTVPGLPGSATSGSPQQPPVPQPAA